MREGRISPAWTLKRRHPEEEFGMNREDNEPESIARRCYQAYVDKDRPAIEKLVAEDFHFTSPLDNRIDRRTYFERCWPNSRWIAGYAFVAVVQEGERVYVTYEARSDQGRIFRNTEALTVRNGQVVEAEVYFGWTVPHSAPAAGFIDEAKPGPQ
jgi:ketosteroid isomerase-like protein